MIYKSNISIKILISTNRYINLLIILLISILNCERVQAQYLQPGLCESHCHCPPGEGVVHCDRQDQLLGLPTNVPNDVKKLYIQQQHNFPKPTSLNRLNMSGLENLEFLQIIYCNIQSIEPKTFINMVNLKHLDLSHNAILRLEPFTFYGLNLQNLYLNKQLLQNDQELYMSEDVFNNLQVNQINLRGNNLKIVIYDVFNKILNLERLILSENQIESISDEFENYFKFPNRLLDLTGNPLKCSCNLAWIVKHLNDWNQLLTGLNITCVRYNNNKKFLFELKKLDEDLLCPNTRISHVWVNILEDNSDKILISCTAETMVKKNTPDSIHFNFDSPEVAWRYNEDGHLREIRHLAEKQTGNELTNSMKYFSNGSMKGFPSATVQMYVPFDSQSRNFTCLTWNDKKENGDLLLTIKGPEINTMFNNSITQSSTPVNPKENKIENSYRAGVVFERPNYFFQKQFSVLEMIGAVIGTFLSTSFLLLLGAKCLKVCSNQTLFHLTSSCSSIINVSDSKGIYSNANKLNNRNDFVNHDQINNTTPIKQINELVNNANSNLSNNTSNFMNQSITTSPGAVSISAVATNNGRYQPQMIVQHLSPQINQLTNLANQYLTMNAHNNLPSFAQNLSNSTNTNDIQSGLALLTSTPLLHQSHFRTLLSNETDPNVCSSPFFTNSKQDALNNSISNNNINHYNNNNNNNNNLSSNIINWPITPGSPYSMTGSHEYDIPRIFDIPINQPFSNTINRKVLYDNKNKESINYNDFS